MKNFWVIGDIHGEADLLDRLLEQIHGFEPEVLVFVGDYIDRGGHSREVIDRLLDLGDRAVCLMGNHELMMLNAMEDLGIGHSAVEQWYFNGGEATLQSFGFTSFFTFRSDMDPVYLDFFRSLKMSFRVPGQEGPGILVTHAGISPFIPLDALDGIQHYDDLVAYLLHMQIGWEDSFLWVRDAFFNASPDLWDGYVVVHGHTPVMKLQRFILRNGNRNYHFLEKDLCLRRDVQDGSLQSVDIDSGSFMSGRLSGIGFFEEEVRGKNRLHMRSLTVSREDIFPRDLGYVDELKST
jgi:serine/threonine protein phosphatase 1